MVWATAGVVCRTECRSAIGAHYQCTKGGAWVCYSSLIVRVLRGAQLWPSQALGVCTGGRFGERARVTGGASDPVIGALAAALSWGMAPAAADLVGSHTRSWG